MISFFRKFRQKVLKENRLGKYAIYALGEIFLVVIGILIALQINNWNEDRKQEKQVETVLKIVEENLKSDTMQLKIIIEGYERLDSLIEIVLEGNLPQAYFDTINETNYQTCPLCFGLNAVVYDFYPETKGFELLKSINTHSKNVDDNQVRKITRFYEQSIGRIIDMRNYNFELATANLKAREEFDWHADFCNKTFNREFVDYFSQSQLYRNKLGSFKVIAIQNYFALLKMYQDSAIVLLEEFENEKN